MSLSSFFTHGRSESHSSPIFHFIPVIPFLVLSPSLSFPLCPPSCFPPAKNGRGRSSTEKLDRSQLGSAGLNGTRDIISRQLIPHLEKEKKKKRKRKGLAAASSRMSHSSQNTRRGALTRGTRDDTAMTRTRRTYSPSSRSRSSSAGPRGIQHHRRPSIKTAAVLIAAVAVASLCVRKLWPRGTARHPKKQDWDRSLTPPGRRSRRRNVIRDRHNGYLDYDDHNVFDRNDYYRPGDDGARGALPGTGGEPYYPPRGRGDGRSRGYGYGSDSDGDSYYSDDYLPSPSERFSGRRGRSRGFGGADEENEVARYEKQSIRSEADKSRFEEARPRYNEAVEDWSRRGGQRYQSPSDERGYRGEPEYVDRRSRRRSDY
ncbi:hypothetical protein CTA2_10459 [Colletotrichum tanaceti]|nr:hypothetical protein CTA2_10459 [Colletotrichum tanaceti]